MRAGRLGEWQFLAHNGASEEKARELEIETAHFRDRAARAEEWLLRIHNEVQDTFFQKKDPAPRRAPRQ